MDLYTCTRWYVVNSILVYQEMFFTCNLSECTNGPNYLLFRTGCKKVPFTLTIISHDGVIPWQTFAHYWLSLRRSYWSGQGQDQGHFFRRKSSQTWLSAGKHFANNLWAHNPNIVKIFFPLNFHCNDLIISQFCTCNGRSAIMTCAKLWSDQRIIFFNLHNTFFFHHKFIN